MDRTERHDGGVDRYASLSQQTRYLIERMYGDKMNKTLALILCAVFSAGPVWCGVVEGSSGAQITNYTTEGNLESSYDVGCVGSEGLSNKYTPADLYKGLAKCLKDGNYDRGVLLFAMAGVYSTFDILRVADESAHDAPSVLQMTYMAPLGESKMTEFGGHLKKTLGVPAGLSRICAELRKIGAPSYSPRYMIQHGMGAVLGDASKDGLVGGFEPEPAWEKALDSYLHCPKV